MLFCDLALARRLERAEGDACACFSEARKVAFPGGSQRPEAVRIAGAYVVFDGVESPITQTFGLGLFEEAAMDVLDRIEAFFRERGAAIAHEVCPLVGPALLRTLCERGYRPVEVSTVLFRTLDKIDDPVPSALAVRIAREGDGDTWAQTSAKGWADEQPGLEGFILELGRIFEYRPDLYRFLVEVDEGVPAAAGVMSICEGVALLSGSSTVPGYRRRGAQAALLQARLRFAREQGCDLAMMVAEAGSGSQRNAERRGFRVAYTRTKWQLDVRPTSN